MVPEFVERVTAMIYRHFGGTEMMEYYLNHIGKVSYAAQRTTQGFREHQLN
jgi:hypothetical protein